MRPTRANGLLVAMTNLLAFTPLTSAHSWVEQLMRISSNGTMVGEPGYPRGAVSRSDPGFSDSVFVHLLPPNGRAGGPVILADDKISKNPIEGAYRSDLPKLRASPGELVALRYQENGHVSLPQNQPGKPLNRGTVFVYGTSAPRDDDALLSIHKVWTADGTGGDGRGKLLATRNYDDGQCYQINGDSISKARQSTFSKTATAPMGADLWCQTDVRLPTDLSTGDTYTIYWVWDWPTLDDKVIDLAATTNGIYPTQGQGVRVPEVYTSAMDIDIVTSADSSVQNSVNQGSKLASVSGSTGPRISFVKGQDLNNAAIQGQLENQFLVKVDGSDSGNGDGNRSGTPATNAPPTVAPTATTLSTRTRKHKGTTTSVPVETSQSTGPNVVTVTLAPTTVVITQTVTAGEPAATSAADSAAEPSLEVEPFMRRRFRGRSF